MTEVKSGSAHANCARQRAGGKFVFVEGKKLYHKGVTYGTFRPDECGNAYDALTAEAGFAQMRSNGINEVPGSIVRWHGRHSSKKLLECLYWTVHSEDPGGLVTYINFLTTESLTGRSVPLSISPRRRGDPAMVAAGPSGARAILGGGPQGPGLALHGVGAYSAVAGWMVHLDLT